MPIERRIALLIWNSKLVDYIKYLDYDAIDWLDWGKIHRN